MFEDTDIKLKEFGGSMKRAKQHGSASRRNDLSIKSACTAICLQSTSESVPCVVARHALALACGEEERCDRRDMERMKTFMEFSKKAIVTAVKEATKRD